MRRLGAQNLAEEHPSRLVQWLFYSHPPMRDRIAAAQAAITTLRQTSRVRDSASRSAVSASGRCAGRSRHGCDVRDHRRGDSLGRRPGSGDGEVPQRGAPRGAARRAISAAYITAFTRKVLLPAGFSQAAALVEAAQMRRDPNAVAWTPSFKLLAVAALEDFQVQ